ncbi:MAG: Gfo/Idh/MocA family oxidoreductase [Armatimonadota bacterium]|nr:Gfo/Idh/MocA family oxidoreductase [Armatimonadota bacterium]
MASDKTNLTRREFLKTSGAAVAAVGLGVAGTAYAQEDQRKSVPASEKIILGIIGCGGRGQSHINWFGQHADVEIGAVCDVYDKHLEQAVARTGGKAKAYKDFRQLLEQKDIDAVVVATPPHWHPLISIYACQAGKDVYCEKPICLVPAEAYAMLKAAREYKRVTQVGTQIHAGDNFRRCVEIVRSGMLGKIPLVHVVCTLNEYPGGIGRPADTPPPPGLDWNMWLGPAPEAPFNMAKFINGNHRYFKDYVGSWLNELGPHIVDLAYWAMEPGEPTAVSASGGRFVADDIGDIPDVLEVLWEYPSFVMSWIHSACNSFNYGYGNPPNRGRRLSVMFHGNYGTLCGDYSSRKIVPEDERLANAKEPEPSIPSSPGHEREFLNAVKTRVQPSCSFEYHVPLAVTLTLGHIALRTGRKIRWDPVNHKVIGDREAERLCYPNYRKPWQLPT